MNLQVGAYMDAMAGFAGHVTRVERQVHRVNRPERVQQNPDRVSTVVWASYEDPSQPDIIHNRIVRADQYLAANGPGGVNERQHARSILVFLYTYWELEIRPRLAAASDVEVSAISADIMGDIRYIRNAVLHNQSVLSRKDYDRLRATQDLFKPEEEILLPYEVMHRLFVLAKQQCASLLLKHLGVDDGPLSPQEVVDVAIQRTHRTDNA